MADTTDVNLYGEGAIVGSKEDATAIQERDVSIQTSGSNVTTVKVGSAEGQEDETKVEQVDPNKAPEASDSTEGDKTPEQVLEADVKNQLAAENDLKEELKGKGVDFDSVAKEYENSGTLSADTFQKLQDAGYSKAVVDAYIAGMEATAERFERTVHDYVGGKEQFQRLSQFVASQGQETVDAFNKVVGTGDLMQIKLALQGFQAQMSQKYGTQGRSIMGSGNVPTVSGYSNKAEMVTAMSDPRYGRDPGYTRSVQDKTMRSTFL